MRITTFLFALLLTGLFAVSFNTTALAGFTFVSDCVEFCADECDAAMGYRDCVDDCDGERGRAKGQCISECNHCADCCYYTCLDNQCGVATDREPEVCDLTELDCSYNQLCSN